MSKNNPTEKNLSFIENAIVIKLNYGNTKITLNPKQ